MLVSTPPQLWLPRGSCSGAERQSALPRASQVTTTRWMPRRFGAEPGVAVELTRTTVAPSPRSRALAQESVQTSQPVRLVKGDRKPRNDPVDERQTRAHLGIRSEGDERDPRPEGGQDPSRPARPRIAGNRRDLRERRGERHRGIGECTSVRPGRTRHPTGEIRGALDLAQRGDPGGGLGRLERVGADRGFAAQHDRVGSVEDRIGDVAGLGPRRSRSRDH